MADPINYLSSDRRRRMGNALTAQQYDRATPQDTTVTERAGLLPIGTYANGMTGLAFPGFLADPVRGFISEATNPVPYLNRSEDEKRQAVETGFDVAGAAMVGGLAAPKPIGIVGSAGGRLSDRGAAAGAAVNALDNPPAGIRAYHGSPHDFDRFDISKIGTGEGAQAYGHGLYFAENEGVAGAYKKQLTDRTNFIRPDGSMWTADGLEHMNVRAVARRGDLDAAIAKARELAATDSPVAGHAKRDLDVLTQIKETGGIQPNPGRMYEVNIRANPEGFLDWDKPLSQQSEKVRAILEHPKVAPLAEGGWQDRVRGSQAYGAIAGEGGLSGTYRNADAATAALREAGIPGIRYLDQGSRTAGEGSRNYVVFDDNLIEILRKYGMLGMAGGGAAYNALTNSGQPQTDPRWSNKLRPGDA